MNITHRNPKKAILFSDLHYSYETESICFQVLEFIHQQAVKHKANVFFLGDFWDHVYRRGTLPVDLLNRMIRFFKDKWKANTIMIPGNHDWFDSAETEHGLEAFHGINHIEVIDKFTERDNMLFLPYCKDVSKIKEIVAMQKGWKCGFAHIDVIGAKMNNHRVSTRGLPSSTFRFPVYTGHYHSPSSHGNVHYIGSPYQVHLGEAGDQKSLKVIDLNTGLVCKDIPMDIGRRHFKMVRVEDVSVYRKGDRLVLTEEPTIQIRQQLIKKGVVIQILTPPKKISEIRLKEDPTNMIEYWKKYCHIKGISNHIMEYSIQNIIQSDKLSLYRDKLLKESIVCDMKKMRIMNFGPFVGDHVIHFEDGMTLVTGDYKTREGNDSNGAGKSLYTAGALLWVLTGRTDPRFGESSHVSNELLISHGKQFVSVSIHGSINGNSFVVTRSKKQLQPCKLTFTIEDSDTGNNTIKMTQSRINRHLFGLDSNEKVFDFLTRTIIWTQKKVLRFLDSSDKASKDEIAKLVDIDKWKEMWELCHSKVNQCKHMISNMEREILYEEKRLKEEEERIKQIQQKIKTWHADKKQKVQDLEQKLASHPLGEKPIVDEERRVKMSVQIRMLEDRLHAMETKNTRQQVENQVQFQLMRNDRVRFVKKNQQILQKIRTISALGSTCHVCSADISPEKVALQIKEYRSNMTDLVEFDKTYKNDVQEAVEKSTKHNSEVRREEIIQLGLLRGEMDKMTKKKFDICRYNTLKKKRSDWELLLDHRKKETCPYDIPLLDASAIEVLQVQLKQAKEENKTLMVLDNHFGRTGIQSYLIESTTQKLSEKVKGLCGMSFDIGHTNKEKLDKTVNGNPLWLMSGGEYQRLQIAFFLSYRCLFQEIKGWRCNLMVLDEPDTHVDGSGVKEMMKMISDQTTGCTMVVSHTNMLHRDMSMFDKHVVIERDEKGSRKRKNTL